MSFIKFIWISLWRKPLRTLLLMFCVCIAFLIYGLTASFISGSNSSSAANEQLLGTVNKLGRSQTLPIAYLNRFSAIDDIAAMSYVARLRGFVEVEKNVVSISAANPDMIMATSGPDLGLSPTLIASLKRSRDFILVGRALADSQGWSVGQRISVTAFQMVKLVGSRNWSFEIAGIFEGANASSDTYFILARYDYINALRAKGKDTVNAFVLKTKKATEPNVVAAKIDKLFANSASPTKTQSEKQFLEAFLRQFADVSLIINLVVGAAFITILMIVINTMVFAIRERRFEIGVLKILGFSRSRIMVLILFETLFVFLMGGLLGLALSKLATELAPPELGLSFTIDVVLKAALIIITLGMISGLLPAIKAMRIPIVNALRAR